MALAYVYIDGFNLYYGALKGSPYKWLDLAALCHLMLPNDTIQSIKYFTAIVSARPYDLDLPVRQQMYLRALKTIGNLIKRIRQADIIACQFPTIMNDSKGQFHKPPTW
jgi:hypothetical protein